MLGGIAVEEKINACEAAQISVGLHVGKVITLCESSDTCHNVFYPVKYFFLGHDKDDWGRGSRLGEIICCDMQR